MSTPRFRIRNEYTGCDWVKDASQDNFEPVEFASFDLAYAYVITEVQRYFEEMGTPISAEECAIREVS